MAHSSGRSDDVFKAGLERKVFTGPSKELWDKHDEIRAAFKELDPVLGSASARAYRAKARDLARRIRTMIVMEEKILYPNALKRLSDADGTYMGTLEMSGDVTDVRALEMSDADGTYMGMLEMSGDVTDVRALEGQLGLLDW